MLASLAECSVPGVHSFLSDRAEAVHDLLAKRLSNHRFQCGRTTEIDARVYSAEIGSIHLVDLQYGATVDIEAQLSEDYFLVHLALDGETTMWSDGEKVLLRKNEMLISSPGAPLKVHMTEQCRHFAVRMPTVVCTDYLSQQLQIPLTRPLEFYPDKPGGRELPGVWRGMMHHIGDQMRCGPTIIGSRRMQKQYGMLLAELLLANYCNSYSEQIALHGNDISPRHVRRAREIIHHSVEENISISALAAQVGVSVRSLQNGFKHFLGLTPIEYVRRHRLERLHAALMDNDGTSSVTELMLECGIMNFGRYAQYYRKQYGCLPSETIRARQ